MIKANAKLILLFVVKWSHSVDIGYCAWKTEVQYKRHRMVNVTSLALSSSCPWDSIDILRDGDGNESGKNKSNRFRLVKQQTCTSITLFCAFPCRRCATTTWKCLMEGVEVPNGRRGSAECHVFLEDVNTRQRPSFASPELWYGPLESQLQTNSPTFDELNEMA